MGSYWVDTALSSYGFASSRSFVWMLIGQAEKEGSLKMAGTERVWLLKWNLQITLQIGKASLKTSITVPTLKKQTFIQHADALFPGVLQTNFY